jgi:hypothetical protein
LHPLASKGGAIVSKLGLVFNKKTIRKDGLFIGRNKDRDSDPSKCGVPGKKMTKNAGIAVVDSIGGIGYNFYKLH